ncbi:MAG: hypothetical protein ACR2I8_04320 [Steroidobacteraceae bacterium]
MVFRAFGLVLLLVMPAAAAYLTGHAEFGHYAVLGTVLAFYLGVQARQLAAFGVLIPIIYAAAAITSNLTDGVAALILPIAAATGAASSLGYHRALLAVLAAALIGSSEPAVAELAGNRALVMFGGCAYGVLLVQTIGRSLTVPTLAVDSRTALGYAVLLPVLVLTAWYTARTAQIEQAWWLPLAMAALGEPSLEESPGRAVARLALAMTATLLMLTLLEPIMEPALRAACALVLLVSLVLVAGHGRTWLQGFLFTPVLVLLAVDDQKYASANFLEGSLYAFAAVAVFTVLGKWTLWTLRPDHGHAVA